MFSTINNNLKRFTISSSVMEKGGGGDGDSEMSSRRSSSSQSQSLSQQNSPNRRSRPQSDEGRSSGTSPEMPTSSNSTKSFKTSKVCRVCGDKAKSFHFGGLSCDSCKAFFRRSVQHEAYASFQCAYESSCSINMSTRKSCQKCRFEKCLAIGMEKSWVMTPVELNALNQQRLERKQQILPQTPPLQVERSERSKEAEIYSGIDGGEYTPDVSQMLNYMNEAEQDCIKDVVEYYRKSYLEIPYRVPKSTDGPRNSLQIVDMFTTILRRFAYFSKLIPEFSELSRDDQGNLLRASVLEMCLLRGALSFDTQNHRWPNTNMELLKHCPQLKVEDMEKLVSRELYELHMNFIHRMQKMKVDEPTVMLLLLVVLFYPERSVVQDVEKVNQAQEKYLILLEKYVAWRYGPKKGPKLYPHLLTKLTDLRQLNDLHTEYNLKLDKSEVEIIRKGLGELQLNPYPQWNIVQVEGIGQSGMESLETVGSPEFPPQPVESQSPPAPQHSYTRRSNPMAEAFLKRIPALIDDPFAPLISDSEMQAARARFEAVLAGRENTTTSRAQSSSFHSSSSGQTSPEGRQNTSGGGSQDDRSPVEEDQGQRYHNHNLISNPQGVHNPQQPFGGFSFIPDQMSCHQRPKNLETTNVNPQADLFRQMSESLSPEARAQLGALVGNRIGPDYIPQGIDLSKIPHEFISSFLGGGSLAGGQGPGKEGQSPNESGSPNNSGGWQSAQTGRMPPTTTSENYPWN